jgi:transcriptional regulator with XRE-family HTH domain
MPKIVFRIADKLKERGMTEADLATELEISLSYVRALVYQQKSPSLKLLVRIAYALRCKVKDLFDEIDDD